MHRGSQRTQINFQHKMGSHWVCDNFILTQVFNYFAFNKYIRDIVLLVRYTGLGVQQSGSQPLLFTNCVTSGKFLSISIHYFIIKMKLIIDSMLQGCSENMIIHVKDLVSL